MNPELVTVIVAVLGALVAFDLTTRPAEPARVRHSSGRGPRR